MNADLQHVLFHFTFDGQLSLAPIVDPQNVLDFATGKNVGRLRIIYIDTMQELVYGRSILVFNLASPIF